MRQFGLRPIHRYKDSDFLWRVKVPRQRVGEAD